MGYFGKLIGKSAMKGATIVAKTGATNTAKIAAYKVMVGGGKFVIVTAKIVGGAIVGMWMSTEFFG